jgi:hypothetical protein
MPEPKDSARGFDISLKELGQLMELRGAVALEKVLFTISFDHRESFSTMGNFLAITRKGKHSFLKGNMPFESPKCPLKSGIYNLKC